MAALGTFVAVVARVGPRAAGRLVKIGGKQFDDILNSAGGGRALRKLGRRQTDRASAGLFDNVPLNEQAALDTVRSILNNATSSRFGRLGLAGFRGEKGVAFFDDLGRGVLVRQSDSSFITFLESQRGLGDIFN